nr:Multimodular transpeptidase-transglycosylase [Kibdelosporangium sp. MJ126-NF4]
MPPPGSRPPAGQQTVRVPQSAPAEQPTDVVSAVGGSGGRERVTPEPELLTHREFDDPEDYVDPDSQYGEPVISDEEARRLRRKKIWRRVRRTSYVFLALAMIGPIIAFFIAYQIVDVPDPNTLANQLDKTVTFTYADNSPFMTVAPKGRRTLVQYPDIPKHVLHAVYASEDATFETNDGFDLSGIARAVWNNLTGGGGGGSTITQQYVKKATGNEDKTLTRKALELVTAYKLSNTKSKEDIITGYLNTIYFGKRAYGIAAAAEAYFGKPLDKINEYEAATLAGVIQTPTKASKDPDYVRARWEYVMGKLVENNRLTPEQKANAVYPEPVAAKTEGDAQPGGLAKQFIWQQAMDELEAAGFPEEQINKNGYKIQLTIDPAAQEAAAAAADSVMNGQPENLRKALVAVDPNTGRIVASYGYNSAKNGTDYTRGWYNPGSSFKPFDLVALLHKGKGLGETYDGRSGRSFGGSKKINNSEGNDSCGERCSVATAMEKSINTVFADMAFNTTGLANVAKAAIESGIPANIGREKAPLEKPLDLNIAIGGGRFTARPIDMAGAYATFAANGAKRTPHVVAKMTDPNNGDTVIYDGDQSMGAPKPAFSPTDPTENAKIARNVTESLIPVINTTKNGAFKCIEGRDCAGKTGTHGCAEVPNKTKSSDNCAAWMVGYSPQISASVWVGSDDNSALRNKQKGAIFGSGLPSEIWKKFMDSYLKGKPKADFGKYVPIGLSPQQAQTETKQTDDNTKNNNTPTTSTTSNPPSQPQTPTDTPDQTTTSSKTKTNTQPGGGYPCPGGGRPTCGPTPTIGDPNNDFRTDG